MVGTLPILGNAPTLNVVAFAGSFYGWALVELFLQYRVRRAGSPATRESPLDRGSVYVIILAVWVSIAVDFAFSVTGVGALPSAVFWPGIALVWVGTVVRGWAVRTLGRFFSLVVRIRSDHRLIRAGPYRLVRHPAYTGALLSLLGISLALETGPGLAVTLILMLASYLYRIKVEEAGLQLKFGEEFYQYARTTWRLFPFLY